MKHHPSIAHTLLFFSSSFFFQACLIFVIPALSSALTNTTTSHPTLISLLSLKSSLNDPLNTLQDWHSTPSNDTPTPFWCTWYGITCDLKTSEITSLDLSRRNISGTIPATIADFTYLQYLNLSRNAFNGPLQPAIFQLQNLETLDISYNYFNSTFSTGISNVKQLTHFDAYSNNFKGPLPEELISLQFLDYLNLGGSYFQGSIPPSYGSFPKLKYLFLHGNLLTGSIPPELGLLIQLQHLEIGYNNYTGELPFQLTHLQNLQYLDISVSSLSGALPPAIGNLTGLQALLLYRNNLSGEIPGSISQLRGLKQLDLSDNNLSGTIPEGITSLKELQKLSLLKNKLKGEIPRGIGSELPNLENLFLWNNFLTGTLPQGLGSNGKLKMLDVSNNSFTGPIPPNLCLGNKLFKLILFSNNFSGGLPSSLVNCSTLWRFRIQGNKINGSIPAGFGLLPNLTFMDVSSNNFTGRIPSDLGKSTSLENLNLSKNSFGSNLPDRIWYSPKLMVFSASYAMLVGEIPDFVGCLSLYRIELEGNNLSGRIPSDVDHCQKLVSLNLRRNSITGIIPLEISNLPSLMDVDLSYNLLTGTIPSSFEDMRTLESFNVSYNHLTGPLPSRTVFASLHPSSFIGNEGLCGGILKKPCRTDGPEAKEVEDKQVPQKRAGTVVWIIAAAFGVGMFIIIGGSRWFLANYRHRFSGDGEAGQWKLTAFQRLNFTADDVLESVATTDTIVGVGSTGTVYRAEMPRGEIIAVKKLWGIRKDTIRRRRGVLSEVEVLGSVRHRNIVRLLGCCSNNRCTMLLYEYMANGSLEDLLHGKNKAQNLAADWQTRYKIAMGVAQGVCYLHHDCDPLIVHRDLKPSNILLDGDMEARLADFGVAKLIQPDESMSVIAGSYGYIAPEYAYTLQVDEKSDIYSYGVVLMEILTGKRSVEAEFGEGNSIVDWVRGKMKGRKGLSEVLDKNGGGWCGSVREEMVLLLRIALLCTSPNPADRPSMRDVVLMLQQAKPKTKSGEKVIDVGGVLVEGGVVVTTPDFTHSSSLEY